MLYKYTHPCLRFASEQLRSIAVKEMNPFVLAAIAQLDNKEGAERRYWMETLNDSLEAHKEEARMYLCSPGGRQLAGGLCFCCCCCLCCWKRGLHACPQGLRAPQAWRSPRAEGREAHSAWDAAAGCWRSPEAGCCRDNPGHQNVFLIHLRF